MSYPDNYVAVGVANDRDYEHCVVLVISGSTVLKLPEDHARKLADDLLRNANYLWPQEENEE